MQRWKNSLVLGLAAGVVAAGVVATEGSAAPDRLLLTGTVVTMDANHTVLNNGRVLISGNKIQRIWTGNTPLGVSLRGVRAVDAGPGGLIFPGLINIHDHPSSDVLPKWLPPSSHVQADGRLEGTEPYANRYQWSIGKPDDIPSTRPWEQARLVPNAVDALAQMGLTPDMNKHAEVQAALGGETTLQGVDESEDPPDYKAVDPLLVRNVEATNFGRDRIRARIGRIDNLPLADAQTLRYEMIHGTVDAWLVHLAEGVRDGQRREGNKDPGDHSSRAEFDSLTARGLLLDGTVVVHGTALERADFAAMRAARPAGAGDGLGAKLVWSPLSNLLLYGATTEMYDALAEGLTVSLGTDWTPSGSNTLLDELKIADVALRDPKLLGDTRSSVPALADEALLDRTLVDMVTRNPALALRWPEVGTIGVGKVADLLVLRRPTRTPTNGMPDSPYRSLIDATSQDVKLVLVGGNPIAGDLPVIASLRGADKDVVGSPSARSFKAVDATKGSSGPSSQRLAAIEKRLRDALAALGGFQPRGGQRVYPYLRQHWNGGDPSPLTQAEFRDMLEIRFPAADGSVNLERMQLNPLFTRDDDFTFAILGAMLTPAGRIDDPTPPYKIYAANLNHLQAGENPFEPAAIFDRWYG